MLAVFQEYKVGLTHPNPFISTTAEGKTVLSTDTEKAFHRIEHPVLTKRRLASHENTEHTLHGSCDRVLTVRNTSALLLNSFLLGAIKS